MIFRVGLGLLLLVSIVSLLPFSIAAQTNKDDRVLGESGLPLPRFVAISENMANVRRGPGEDYPLLYQYRRQGLPLEVVAEYGQWRQVRDHEGSEGWMHARLLRGGRHAIIRQAANALPLRNAPAAGAGVVARTEAERGVCARAWGIRVHRRFREPGAAPAQAGCAAQTCWRAARCSPSRWLP